MKSLNTFGNFGIRAKKEFYLLLKLLVFVMVIFQLSSCQSVETTGLKEQTPKNITLCNLSEIALLADEDANKQRSLIKTEFERNCRLWHEKNILDYDIFLEGWQEASVPQVESALIKVRDGTIQSIEPNRPASYELMISVYEQFGTVNKMFDEIRSALKEKTELKVSFNKEFGYPENLEIDYLLANDRSYRVSVKKFEMAIANTSYPIPKPTGTLDTTFRNENVESLCNRLQEIKKIPYRDPNDTDPIYEELIFKGKEAMPCLIEKITDETPMPDPREAPSWSNYKVGDTAVFILVRLADEAKITTENEIFVQMLPAKYKKEWKTNGVYAYFNYVSESKNRDELQRWWRNWIKENQDS